MATSQATVNWAEREPPTQPRPHDTWRKEERSTQKGRGMKSATGPRAEYNTGKPNAMVPTKDRKAARQNNKVHT